MNKTELIEKIAAGSGLKKAEARMLWTPRCAN